MARKSKRQTRTNSTAGVTVPARVQEGILGKINMLTSRYDFGTQRTRLEAVDKAIQLETDAPRPNRQKHGYMDDTQPPVLKPEIDTAHAFYTDLFCSGDPMFKVIENNSNAAAAKMMQAQVTSDELHYGYAQQVAKFLRDAIKYNEVSALEVLWEKEEVYQPMNDLTFTGNDEKEATTTLYEGNKVKRIDPYNLFYDKSVPANEVSQRGQYAGYFERMPLTELHQLLTSYRAAGKEVLNENRKMWESRPRESNHYIPNIMASTSSDNGQGWGSFFFPDDVQHLVGSTKHNVNYSEHYEVTTIYMRIIPEMFNMKVAAARRVQIWKFVIVNGQYIVLAERQTNGHNRIPMLVAQMSDDGIWSDSKSLAEFLIPIQNQSTQMHDAWLGMVWKAVSDKGIYDARRISKRDIESKNPTAKIPARPNANNSDLRGAYIPIPYDGSAGNIIQQALGSLRNQSSEISGQNSASRGQFQKGNKTMAEYQDVMGNGDARKYVQAIVLENIVFQPLKNIMKLNILQFANSGQRTANGESVEINPAEMRKATLEFRIADGLKNVERIAKTGELVNIMQLMAPYAAMAPAYGVDPFMMILEYMRNRGMPIENYNPQNLDKSLLPTGGNANAPQSGTDGEPPQ